MSEQSGKKTSLLTRLKRKSRIVNSILLGVVVALLIQPSRGAFAAGFAIIALGEGLRLWASGHIHKSRVVTTTGPYALCRHPLYLGHFIIAVGFCVAGDSLWALLVAAPGFWFIYYPTMRAEERHLTDLFGSAYVEYMRRTPMFLPRWHANALDGAHDWALVRQHREWNNILGLFAGVVLIVALGLWKGSW